MSATTKQIALDLAVPSKPTLAGYHPGESNSNIAVLEHLRQWTQDAARSQLPVYLWGASGCGKTHLLRAAQAALRERGQQVGWLDTESSAVQPFNSSWSAVMFDDVDVFNQQRQHTAFNWMVNAMTPTGGHTCAVLACGQLPPTDLQLREDLRTRLGWGLVFELEPLSDTECRTVLIEAARERGLKLPNEVLDFILTRFSRDLGSLMQLLDAVDRYALKTQRAITIPLVKDMLLDA
jgi:DnaA family protein